MILRLSMLLLTLTIMASGCATLSKEGRMVREFSGTPEASCTFLGRVSGSSASAVGTDGVHIAKVDIFNETAKLGGNFVRLENYGYIGTFGSIYGEAFRCSDNIQLVRQEPTPEQQVADELRRKNDIEAQAQRTKALQNFASQLNSTTPPTKQLEMKCLNDCLDAGYLYNFCASRCGY